MTQANTMDWAAARANPPAQQQRTNNPAVGYRDGYGFVDADGNPTTQTDPTMTPDYYGDIITKSQAPVVNMSGGGAPTNGTIVDPVTGKVTTLGADRVAGSQTTTYRAGVDDRPWTHVAQPSAYLYGGVPGGADAEAQRYAGLSAATDLRMAPQIASNAYGLQLAGDMAQDTGSRGNQQYGLSQLQNTIEGRGMSVAQQQQNIGLAQAMQQQASIANSARGGGANLAAAQQAAANAAGNMSGNAVQQAGLLRAQEQTAAINAYGQQAGAMRGQDQSRAQLTGQLATNQTGIDLQSRNANDSRNLAYEQMRRGVFQDQSQARQAGEAMDQGIVQQNANRQQTADLAATAERDKIAGTAMTVGGSIAGTLLAPGPGTVAGGALGQAAAASTRK